MKQRNLLISCIILVLSLVAVTIGVSMTGCATDGNQIIKFKDTESEFCSTIPDGETSVLCQLAERIGRTPESMSKLLSVTGLIGAEQWYTAQQAYDFLTDVIDHAEAARALTEIGGGRTWLDVVTYVTAEHAKLPARMQAALILLSDIIELDVPEINVQMVPLRDWDAIIKDLYHQRDLISPYIKS